MATPISPSRSIRACSEVVYIHPRQVRAAIGRVTTRLQDPNAWRSKAAALAALDFLAGLWDDLAQMSMNPEDMGKVQTMKRKVVHLTRLALAHMEMCSLARAAGSTALPSNIAATVFGRCIEIESPDEDELSRLRICLVSPKEAIGSCEFEIPFHWLELLENESAVIADAVIRTFDSQPGIPSITIEAPTLTSWNPEAPRDLFTGTLEAATEDVLELAIDLGLKESLLLKRHIEGRIQQVLTDETINSIEKASELHALGRLIEEKNIPHRGILASHLSTEQSEKAPLVLRGNRGAFLLQGPNPPISLALESKLKISNNFYGLAGVVELPGKQPNVNPKYGNSCGIHYMSKESGNSTYSFSYHDLTGHGSVRGAPEGVLGAVERENRRVRSDILRSIEITHHIWCNPNATRQLLHPTGYRFTPDRRDPSRPTGVTLFKEAGMFFEFKPSLKSDTSEDRYSDMEVTRIAREMLMGVLSLTEAGFTFPTGLKPEYFLLTEDGEIFLDFSRIEGVKIDEGIAEQTAIATRTQYSAPEQGLDASKEADEKALVFSFGLILGHLCQNKHPLGKVRDPVDRLRKTVMLLGKPPAKVKERYSSAAQSYIDSLNIDNPTQLELAGEQADLVAFCLQWDPEDRPSLRELYTRVSKPEDAEWDATPTNPIKWQGHPAFPNQGLQHYYDQAR